MNRYLTTTLGVLLLLGTPPAHALRLYSKTPLSAGQEESEEEDELEERGKLSPDGIGKAITSMVCKARNWLSPSDSMKHEMILDSGPVMKGTPVIYYIWYGDWSGSPAIPILTDLARGIGGSEYFQINTTYHDRSGKGSVTGLVNFGGSVNDDYSRGPRLSGGDIQAVVESAIGNGSLPADPDGVYFVLTSSDVDQAPGFCTDYCGWHTRANINGVDIKYSFVGNPERCSGVCEAQQWGTPNGDPGADGMASTIAHELEETVSDPDLNGWSDDCGWENADKCAWTFGPDWQARKSNVSLGGRNFLIQRNWINTNGGYCGLSLDDLPPPVIKSAPIVTSLVRKPFNYRIAATNNPTSYGASGLPAGLVARPASGRISGSISKAGIHLVTLEATNDAGEGKGRLTIIAVDPTLDIRLGPPNLDLGFLLELGRKFKL